MAKEQILVVDDEPGMLELISMYLRREGFDVETARDGVSALHKFRDRPPSLIVLDLMLPGIDGWEVCRQVRPVTLSPCHRVTVSLFPRK
jgi:DNA-binding response OmpR family regulator